MVGPGRRASLLTAAALFVLSAGAGAIAFIELPIKQISLDIDDLFQVDLDPDELFQASFVGLRNTGFSILSRDGSALTIDGSSKYDATLGRQGHPVQEGFVLLDGTLSLNVAARKTLADGTRVRARMLTTYRLDVRGRTLRPGISRARSSARGRSATWLGHGSEPAPWGSTMRA